MVRGEEKKRKKEKKEKEKGEGLKRSQEVHAR